jgi:RimJ/RimL family protein N-acetyltransferase
VEYIKKLEGERIYLSPKINNDEDAKKLTIWFNDFNTTDYIGKSARIMTLEEEKRYLESNESDTYLFFIIEKNTDKMIGTIGLHKVNFIHRTSTLGIFIGEEDAHNKGYGKEAIRLILDYGFNYLNLNNINLDVLEFNKRAIECYRKCGFKEYGRRRKSNFTNGKYYDRISMDILKEEFTGSYIKNKNI